MASYKKSLSVGALPSVRQMRAFIAVYQLGSVSAAAEQLSLTQPAVTALIRELETKLNVKLFDRNARGLQRTPAAEEAVGYVMRSLDELHQLHTSLSEYSSVRRGKLRVVATSTVAQTLLPPMIRRFLLEFPGVEVAVQDCGPLDFVRALTSADFGIGSLERAVPELTTHSFLRDELVAAARPSQGFEGFEALSWKQLIAHPLIVVKPGYGIRYLIERTLDDLGLLGKMRVRQEVSLLTTAVAMADAGLGVAVVPRSLAIHGAFPQLVVRRLVRPIVERPVALIHRTDRSLTPAALAFLRMMMPLEKGVVSAPN